MPGHPQSLTVTAVPTYRQLLLSKIYNSTDAVWSLDPATLCLTKWYWPTHARKRVAPSALREHREHHQFLGPSCLCPLLQRVSKEPVITEAAMYIPVFGRYAGEYVAECANSRCGYLVPLQRIYQAANIPARAFPPRENDAVHPPPVLHRWELEYTPRPLKRTYAQADLADAGEPTRYVDLGYQTDWRKFSKLESMDRPGLTEVEFFGLFVKCDACMLVTMRQAFSSHHCSLQVEDDSELTDRE